MKSPWCPCTLMPMKLLSHPIWYGCFHQWLIGLCDLCCGRHFNLKFGYGITIFTLVFYFENVKQHEVIPCQGISQKLFIHWRYGVYTYNINLIECFGVGYMDWHINIYKPLLFTICNLCIWSSYPTAFLKQHGFPFSLLELAEVFIKTSLLIGQSYRPIEGLQYSHLLHAI